MNICIIGKGSIGKRHAKILSKLKYNIFFLRRKANKFNEVNYESINLLKKIDFFIISNPTSLHFKTLKKIEIYKKPILIEKPLFDENANLNSINKKIKKLIFTAYMMRFDPRIEYLRKKINLKEIKIAKFVWTTFMPNWHKNENFRNSYASNKKLGGGVLLTCSHEIDTAIYLFGDVKGAKIIFLKKNYNIDVEEKCLIILKHKSNIYSEIYLDFTCQNHCRTLDIIGKQSHYKWDFYRNNIDIFNKNKKKSIKFKFNLNEVYKKQLKHFINTNKNKNFSKSKINWKNTIETQKVLNILKNKSNRIF